MKIITPSDQNAKVDARVAEMLARPCDTELIRLKAIKRVEKSEREELVSNLCYRRCKQCTCALRHWNGDCKNKESRNLEAGANDRNSGAGAGTAQSLAVTKAFHHTFLSSWCEWRINSDGWRYTEVADDFSNAWNARMFSPPTPARVEGYGDNYIMNIATVSKYGAYGFEFSEFHEYSVHGVTPLEAIECAHRVQASFCVHGNQYLSDALAKIDDARSKCPRLKYLRKIKSTAPPSNIASMPTHAPIEKNDAPLELARKPVERRDHVAGFYLKCRQCGVDVIWPQPCNAKICWACKKANAVASQIAIDEKNALWQKQWDEQENLKRLSALPIPPTPVPVPVPVPVVPALASELRRYPRPPSPSGFRCCVSCGVTALTSETKNGWACSETCARAFNRHSHELEKARRKKHAAAYLILKDLGLLPPELQIGNQTQGRLK